MLMPTAPQAHPSPRAVAWLAGNDKWGLALSYFVYMLASKRNGTLYVGVTNDLAPGLV
jgi:hypothetical protein